MLFNRLAFKFESRQLVKKQQTHCCGHNISLVVVTACKLPLVQNVLDRVKEISRLFVKGSKKMKFLQEAVQ